MNKFKKAYIASGVLVLLVIVGLTVMNPPQCPDTYTQAQIDAATKGILEKCIVGANIGLGLYFMLVVPIAAIISVYYWVKALLKKK